MGLSALLLAALPSTLAVGQEAAPPPDQVILRSGDVLRGEATRNEDGSVTLRHPELGSIRLSAEQVERVEPPVAGTKSPADLVEDEAKRKLEELEAEERKRDWQFFLSLAFAGTFNVNDEITLRAGAGARRADDEGMFDFTVEYYLRTLNSASTDNNLLARALKEWFFPDSKWLLFVEGTYQYDEFQEWEHRFRLYAGPGYRLIANDAMDLTLRLGFGATYEVGPDEWSPQVLFAQDFVWRISDRQRLTLSASFAPDVGDFSDYLLTAGGEYAVAIGDGPNGIALTTGFRNIYDSKPDGDSERNDLRVYAGLRYDF